MAETLDLSRPVLPGIPASDEAGDLDLSRPVLPGISPELHRASELESARGRQADLPGDPLLMTHAVPVASQLAGAAMTGVYHAARARYDAGNPRPEDYDAIARHERLQQLEAQKTPGEQLLSEAARLPAMAGEFALGGGVINAARTIGGRLGFGLGARVLGAALPTGAASTLGRVGAQAGAALGGGAAAAAVVPTMGVPQGIAEGTPGRAFGLATIQGAVLGSASRLVQSQLPGKGVGWALARTGAAAATMPVEQQGADLLTSAVDDALGNHLNLHTGYGLLGNVYRGERGEALQHAFVQAATGAIFHGQHEAIPSFARAAEALRRQGLSAEAAGRRLQQVTQDPAAHADARGAVGEFARVLSPEQMQSLQQSVLNQPGNAPETAQPQGPQGPAAGAAVAQLPPGQVQPRPAYVGSPLHQFFETAVSGGAPRDRATLEQLAEQLGYGNKTLQYMGFGRDKVPAEVPIPRQDHPEFNPPPPEPSPQENSGGTAADMPRAAEAPPPASAPEPVAAAGGPTPPAPKPPDTTGLAAMGGGIGDAISHNLYQGMFERLQAGKRIGGERPPIAEQAAQRAHAMGLVHSVEDVKRFALGAFKAAEQARKDGRNVLEAVGEWFSREVEAARGEQGQSRTPQAPQAPPEAPAQGTPVQQAPAAPAGQPGAAEAKPAPRAERRGGRPLERLYRRSFEHMQLRERQQRGEPVTQEEVAAAGDPVGSDEFLAAARQEGLSAREAHVIQQRLQGRALEEIGSDPEVSRKKGLKPLSRERVRQIEQEALAKLDAEHSIARAIHRVQAGEGAMDKVEQGKAVTPDELHNVEGRQVRQRLSRQQRELDRMADELLKQAERENADESTVAEARRAGEEAARAEDQARAPESVPPEAAGPRGPEARRAADPIAAMKERLRATNPDRPSKAEQEQAIKDAGLKGKAAQKARGLFAEREAEYQRLQGIGKPEAEPGKKFGAPLTPEEKQKGALGGGQPAPEEGGPAPAAEQRTKPPEKKTTALANEVVDKERAQAGKPELLKAARRSNPEVWDRAMEMIDRDPGLPDKLIEELDAKPRATTVEENAILLRQKIALRNEHSRAIREALQLAFRRSSPEVDALRAQADAREASLADQIDRLDRVSRSTGTEWGRAGQFRRQLAAEDYSLSGMLQKARAAKGESLTPEENQRISAMADKIKEMEDKLRQAEEKLKQSGEGAASEHFPEFIDTQAKVNEAQGQFQDLIGSYKLKSRTNLQKTMDWLIKLRVNFVISGPTTLAKIGAASAQRIAISPFEQIAGAAWAKVPGIAKVAALAPSEGRGLRPEVERQALVGGLTQGIRDALETVRTGKSKLDSIHGKRSDQRGLLDYQFSLHDAMKAPAVRAAYERSFLNRLDAATKAGKDVTSPAALLQLSAEAYRDAQAAKFRQDNQLVDRINAFLKPGKNAGPLERLSTTAGKVAMPVLRIPTNFAAEVITHIVGVPTAATRVLHTHLTTGLANIPPAQADKVMREFKKGSVGMALFMVGAALPGSFGGYYSGKRREDDVQAGALRVGGMTVPAWLQHHPLLVTAQAGATFRRAFDKAVGREGRVVASGDAAMEVIAGTAQEVPLVREMGQVAGLTSHNARERGYNLGTFLKSLLVPQGVQWLAGRLDVQPGQNVVTGDAVHRRPEGVVQGVAAGVPLLRNRLPVSHGR